MFRPKYLPSHATLILRVVLAFAAAAALLSSPALAAVLTWDGEAADNFFNDGLNWNPNAITALTSDLI
ncbi:MAG TPA: hypothetical protein VGP94_09990, partial [Tepidisphaeraceae bacterium]|nr:hypothetical protein [Tepidisphaeraceae bacterium]